MCHKKWPLGSKKIRKNPSSMPNRYVRNPQLAINKPNKHDGKDETFKK